MSKLRLKLKIWPDKGLRVTDCESLSKRGEAWSGRKYRHGEINKTTQLPSDRTRISNQGVETFFSDEAILLQVGSSPCPHLLLGEVGFL